MRKKTVKLFLCAGLCAALCVGNGVIVFAETTVSETEVPRERGHREDGSVMAKISSVGSSTLTVYMEEQPERTEDGEKPAEGETPPALPEKPAEGETPPALPEKPAEGETPPALPEKPAEGETPPALPEKPEEGETPTAPSEGDALPEGQTGEAHEGVKDHRGGMDMKFSEETSTLVITSSTTVTKGMEQEASYLSALEADMTVRIVLDGTTVVSIQIME